MSIINVIKTEFIAIKVLYFVGKGIYKYIYKALFVL